MGLLSLLSSNTKKTTSKINFDNYLDKGFFASIVDCSDVMMLYFFQGEGWIDANKTFYEKMGYENIEEFKEEHESVRDLFLNESEEIFTESDKSWLDYVKKHHEKGYRVTMPNPKKKDEVIVVDAKCHTFPQDKNFYVLEFHDVTALHNAKVQTSEVERLKSKFLANIGHEFRTPMNGILGFIELFKNTNMDEKQSEYINMISNASQNLMSNIETLLDLSQLQSGRLELEVQAFNLLPKMETLADNAYILGIDKGINVLSFIDPKLPKEIVSDAKKISQIMFSLSQNAVKFTPVGGRVIIEVKLLKRQQNGDCSIGFGVRDNGSGISPEQIAKIHEPFTAGSHADERLGVGLTLSHGLVKLLGSELRIQSKKDEGTYVNFVLDFKASQGQNFKMMPKKKAKVLLLDKSKIDEANFLAIYLRSFSIDVIKSNQLDSSVYEGIDVLYVVADKSDASWILELGTYSKKTPVVLLMEKNEKFQAKFSHIVNETILNPLFPSSVAKHLYTSQGMKTSSTLTQKIKIKTGANALIVEDNLINQRLTEILLREYDINVSIASNGVEAVEVCSKTKFDIIFMDIDMPEKNGIEATSDIKEGTSINKLTPIVALTAMAMDGDKELLIEKGLDNYLSKPLSKNSLEKILYIYLKESL